ncbi:MAG: MATE family efflux transporter [Hyphomonadaceae bacterium]
MTAAQIAAPRALTPALLRLAWPVALARLGIMGMGVTDVIVVGQLAPHDLAFQALGWAPTGVALVAGIGLLTGVQVLAARAMGAGRAREAGAAWRRGVVVGLAAGVLTGALLLFGTAPMLRALGISKELALGAAHVTAVLAFSLPLHLVYSANASFLEAIQRPTAPMAAMWIANVLNLVLNLLLVPEHGAVGSAAATVVSRAALALGLLIWIWLLSDASALGVRARARSGDAMELLRIGGAAMVSQIAEAGAFSAMTVIAGRISDAAVAAYQILLNVMAVVFMIALGMAVATAVLVSEAIGRKQPAEATRAGWTGLGLNTVAMIAAGVLVAFLAHPIARAFSADPVIAALVAGALPIGALVLAPDGGQVVAAQALRARGDNWFPTGSHVLAYVFVMPPLAFMLAEAHGQGVAGLLVAILISSALSVLVLVARFWALARKPG